MSRPNLQSQDEPLRDHFLGWQCRIRQIAMREDGGRPSPGMQPRVLLVNGDELSPAMTMLIVPYDPEESTEFFRFQVAKTNDPKLVYDNGLKFLQSTHFQRSRDFSDQLTAVHYRDSATANALIEAGECLMEFIQFSQSYRMHCSVTDLSADVPAYQATLWHNRLFNPGLPDGVHVLGFQPDWSSAKANPPV